MAYRLFRGRRGACLTGASTKQGRGGPTRLQLVVRADDGEIVLPERRGRSAGRREDVDCVVPCPHAENTPNDRYRPSSVEGIPRASHRRVDSEARASTAPVGGGRRVPPRRPTRVAHGRKLRLAAVRERGPGAPSSRRAMRSLRASFSAACATLWGDAPEETCAPRDGVILWRRCVWTRLRKRVVPAHEDAGRATIRALPRWPRESSIAITTIRPSYCNRPRLARYLRQPRQSIAISSALQI